MSRTTTPWIAPLLALSIAGAVACSDSKPTEPAAEASPLEGRIQVQSPDTARGNGVMPVGNGLFRGTVMGYSEADFPDTLKSAKRLPNVVVTAYPAELTNADPKLGPAAASVTTNADGQFTFPILPGGLYVVTFAPPAGSPYASAWTIATAHSASGDQPWTIMLRDNTKNTRGATGS